LTSLLEMEYISTEFENRKKPKVTIMLERIMRNLRFFKNFDLPTRKHIIMKSELHKYSRNDKIFDEGDESTSLYMVVQGHVELRKQLKKIPDLQIVLGSMYDGYHFGEQALMADPNFKHGKRRYL
jgi:CRP-like cAMP-binding protein